MKRNKIWDIFIWDELVSVSSEQPDKTYKLCYPLILKIDDTFYSVKATCDIDSKTVRALKSVRASQEKRAASLPPKEEHTDRQMRVTIERGEKGEPVIKLAPVQVQPE
jgi:hypothetical protein